MASTEGPAQTGNAAAGEPGRRGRLGGIVGHDTGLVEGERDILLEGIREVTARRSTRPAEQEVVDGYTDPVGEAVVDGCTGPGEGLADGSNLDLEEGRRNQAVVDKASSLVEVEGFRMGDMEALYAGQLGLTRQVDNGPYDSDSKT